MKKAILCTVICIYTTTATILAANLPDKPYPFKDEVDIRKYNRPDLSEVTKLPSIEEYVQSVLNRQSKLPDVAYSTPNNIGIPEIEQFNQVPPKGLDNTKLTYSSDGIPNQPVYTGYTFNNNLIFPMDLRTVENTANLSNNVKGGLDKTKLNPSGMRVTSEVGFRYLNGREEYHDSLDISGGISERGKVSNANIYSPINCEVINVGTGASGDGGGFGNSVLIEFKLNDNFLYRMLFAHMEKIFVEKGDKLKQGQIIGIMGGTGNNPNEPQYALHLHWMLSRAKSYKNDTIQSYNYYNWKNLGEDLIVMNPLYIYGMKGTGTYYDDFLQKIGVEPSVNSYNHMNVYAFKHYQGSSSAISKSLKDVESKHKMKEYKDKVNSFTSKDAVELPTKGKDIYNKPIKKRKRSAWDLFSRRER